MLKITHYNNYKNQQYKSLGQKLDHTVAYIC